MSPPQSLACVFKVLGLTSSTYLIQISILRVNSIYFYHALGENIYTSDIISYFHFPVYFEKINKELL